jgi:hypothetical protein
MKSFRSLSSALLVVAVVTACAAKKKPGDVCRADPNEAVCTDATHVGSCRAFTWHVDPCRGPGGCASGVCDQSIAAADDSCGVLGARACSADGKQLLRCDGSSMVVERACRGERGCYRTSPNAAPSCDAGPAQVGDACTSTMGSRCSPDGKSILQCSQQTHHMILERHCLGPKGCFPNPHFTDRFEYLACDVSMGDVGQPCIGYAGVGARSGSGGAYCSTDRKELLTCKDGTLVSQSSCACTVTWSADLAAWGVGCAEPPPSGPGRRTHSLGYRSAAYLSIAERP